MKYNVFPRVTMLGPIVHHPKAHAVFPELGPGPCEKCVEPPHPDDVLTQLFEVDPSMPKDRAELRDETGKVLCRIKNIDHSAT